MSTTRARARGDVAARVREMGPWFHNLHLPDGTETAPGHPLGDFPRNKWEVLAPHIPADLAGWTVLDVGCNAGFYAFELAKRGATVTGVDPDPRYLRQARWAAGELGLTDHVRFERAQVYDLAHDDRTFDLVLFLGVLYHLRYPLLGLDAVAGKARRLLAFQSLTLPGDAATGTPDDVPYEARERLADDEWPRMAFIEHAFAGDRTNWWVPNPAGAQALLRAAGLRVTARPEPETFVCVPDPQNPPATRTWNRSELLAATGRAWEEDAATRFTPSAGSIESRAGNGDG